MAEYAVISVIKSITEWLLYEAKHIPEIRGRIELIQMKLRQLQSILEIADARQEVDEGIRSWVAETREVAYDTEDFLLLAVSSRKEGSFLRKYFKEATSFQSFEPKLQTIEAKISALESDLRIRNIKPRNLGLPNPVSRRIQQQRRTYSHYGDEDFVGLENDIMELVLRLKEEGDQCFQVLSITGMGGIGKTAIAKKIYHNDDVRNHFQAFAWVCVSQQWQQEDVLQKILNKLEPEKKKQINRMKVDELVKELFSVQKRKRCMIVFDDVWEMGFWDLLRPAFPKRQMNSKVIFTTRNKEIARYVDMDNPCYLYEQRQLNESESWELLKKKVFSGLNINDRSEGAAGRVGEDEDSSESEDDNESFQSCESHEEEDEVTNQSHTSSPDDYIEDMERLGKEMIGQCGGLPLAIIVLGGLLKTKSTISEWRTVHQHLNSYLRRERSYRENGRVHEVLALSYHDLPFQLKPCFLHLGNFPEDSKIPTRKLYQLWAAEGFLSPGLYHSKDEETIMDVGEHNLRELVERSMVEVRVHEATGRFKSCWLHRLTRELCLLKGKEENFLKKVPFRYEPEFIVSPSLSAATALISITRRLSIAVDYDFDSYFPPIQQNFEHVRSALFLSRLRDRKNLIAALNLLCNESKVLRVLDLERFDFGVKLSKDIGNLVHLSYLSFRGSHFYKLPSSISNLKYLQTLDLRVPFLVCLEIPNVLWKLNNLRNLYLPPSHRSTDDKLQLRDLSKLEILKNFDTRVSDYKDIPKLNKLQKLSAILTLRIENLEAINNYIRLESNHIRDSSFRIRYDFQSERDLALLTQIVGYVHLRKLDLIGGISGLPEYRHFAQSLTTLTLRNSRLKKDPLAILEKLPALNTLILRKNVFEVNEIRCSSQSFCKLRILEFQGLESLEFWTIEEGAMPNLHCLRIDECIHLRMIPEGIKFIGTLKELVIANMPDTFKCRIQKVQGEEGEDMHKTEHIPSVIITETNNSYVKQLESQLSGKNYPGLFHVIPPSLVPKDWQNS